METDPRIAEGMQRGLDLARNGRLQARARELAGEHSSRAARAGELKVHGRQLGPDRAARYRADGRPAAELGFDSLDAYLQQRYVKDGARLEDLQRELAASYSAVRQDLVRAGIKVRRGRIRTVAA
jgi:hypothetical protein